MRQTRHVQAVWQAERAASKDTHGHHTAGAVAAELSTSAAHTGHLVEKRRQTQVRKVTISRYVVYKELSLIFNGSLNVSDLAVLKISRRKVEK